MPKRSKRKAFSYIEVIVIASVIGIVVGGVTIPAYRENIRQSKGRSCHTNLAAIEAAKAEYFSKNPGAEFVSEAELEKFFPDGKIPRCPARPDESYLLITHAGSGQLGLSRDALPVCAEKGQGGGGVGEAGMTIAEGETGAVPVAPPGLHDLGNLLRDPEMLEDEGGGEGSL